MSARIYFTSFHARRAYITVANRQLYHLFRKEQLSHRHPAVYHCKEKDLDVHSRPHRGRGCMRGNYQSSLRIRASFARGSITQNKNSDESSSEFVLCWHLPIFPGGRLRALPAADEGSNKVYAGVEIRRTIVRKANFGHRKWALMGCRILSVGRIACWERPLAQKRKAPNHKVKCFVLASSYLPGPLPAKYCRRK